MNATTNTPSTTRRVGREILTVTSLPMVVGAVHSCGLEHAIARCDRQDTMVLWPRLRPTMPTLRR
jgi:hypothetical protein